MDKRIERRSFERHANNFIIETYSKNSKGVVFKEKTVLRDISGSGGCFTTNKKEHYYLGQSIKISIFMPGNIDVNTSMDGTGTIIRIETSSSNSNPTKKIQTSKIAIKFDAPILLHRYDK